MFTCIYVYIYIYIDIYIIMLELSDLLCYEAGDGSWCAGLAPPVGSALEGKISYQFLVCCM